jgi:hypothetical protein
VNCIPPPPPERCTTGAQTRGKRVFSFGWFGAGSIFLDFGRFVRSFVHFFSTRARQLKSGKKKKKYTHDGDHHHVFWVAESKKIRQIEGEFHHHSNVNADDYTRISLSGDCKN